MGFTPFGVLSSVQVLWAAKRALSCCLWASSSAPAPSATACKMCFCNVLCCTPMLHLVILLCCYQHGLQFVEGKCAGLLLVSEAASKHLICWHSGQAI
ncbi:hypothetical protein DUNSADRAFT_5633 [Dunaliella salina]|uniref:Secreted protein n=1 Tax=Dunaliella salina TaxID=3046 RepID=A0ABQ7GPV0_DUNSA|nr:hypothetical protein DUNSADRAFT_5633 [Dunaliella salina]|eukprot:KAF5836639.1 hypothetical protein DUNSADRAFT_5633 [Dunaliella salina]